MRKKDHRFNSSSHIFFFLHEYLAFSSVLMSNCKKILDCREDSHGNSWMGLKRAEIRIEWEEKGRVLSRFDRNDFEAADGFRNRPKNENSLPFPGTSFWWILRQLTNGSETTINFLRLLTIIASRASAHPKAREELHDKPIRIPLMLPLHHDQSF